MVSLSSCASPCVGEGGVPQAAPELLKSSCESAEQLHSQVLATRGAGAWPQPQGPCGIWAKLPVKLRPQILLSRLGRAANNIWLISGLWRIPSSLYFSVIKSKWGAREGVEEGRMGQSTSPDEKVRMRAGLSFVQTVSVKSGVSSHARCDAANPTSVRTSRLVCSPALGSPLSCFILLEKILCLFSPMYFLVPFGNLDLLKSSGPCRKALKSAAIATLRYGGCVGT